MRWLLWKSVVAGCLLQIVTPAQVPTFRPHVTVVPVDVRALDKTGHPIDDLRQSDFQIFEDGKPQEIAFFSRDVAPGAASRPSAVSPPARAASPGSVAAPTIEPRTFLLVLGRGRLEGPSKGLTALIDFVRTQLGPEDRVGVAAYDRISDLTTDHAAVARLLIRYKDRHEAIESTLSNYLRGLTALYWDGVTMLPSIQADIDRVFQSDGLPRLRRLPMLYGPADAAFGDMRREVLDMFDGTLFTPEMIKAYQDLRQLFVCTEFMRPLAGERHMVFVTEQPPNHERLWQLVDKLALLDSDARITLSTIQTGGLPANFSRGSASDVKLDIDRLTDVVAAPIRPGVDQFPGRTFGEAFSLLAVRGAAQQTGGVFSAYRPASEAVQRIVERTSSRYTLGYYPPESKADGTFHKIAVKVMRSDVDLSYRRGYFASDTAARTDSRAVVSSERVTGAFEDYRTFSDLPVEIAVKAVGRRVDVSLKVDPGAVQFTDHDGRKVATLEIAVAVGRSGKDAHGHKQDAVDLSFDPVEFVKLTREKITYTTSVDVDTDPRNLEVKVVVYDYIADRVGTAVAQIR